MKLARLVAVAITAIALVVAMSPALKAADARIGIRTETQSIDPHFSYIGATKSAVLNIFETLISRDKDQRLQPGLAVEWTNTADKEWTLKLRPGVKWHDGVPFTADDVLFTFARAGNVPNSSAPFTAFLAQIASAEKVDDLTVRVKTKGPSSQFILDMSDLPIVSKHAGEGATTEDYNSGKAAIGTGPYKFVSWQPGGAMSLTRNDDYWGKKPDFATVDFISMPNDASRVAALLAGDVDLIDFVPPDSFDNLAKDERLQVWKAQDVFAAYVHMDTDRKETPFITGNDGSKIPNPLLKLKVREALSKAIDRQAIVDRLMHGLGEVTGQLAGPTMLGYNPEIKATAYDPAGAKALLAEAGYPEGFHMTIHGPSNRYVADAQITQALAQMFERIGIKTAVETMPSNVFLTAASKQEFSIFFMAFGTSQGTAWQSLRGVLMTYNAERGDGTSNRGRYSNPAVDELINKIMATADLDEAARYAREAAAIAYGDYAILPMHYQMNLWAGRKGLGFQARQDAATFAADLSKAE